MTQWDNHLGAELVHHMTELMEVSLYFMVLEERGVSYSSLGKVGYHGGHWKHAFSIRPSAAWLEPKTGCMAKLSFPGGRDGCNCHSQAEI